MFRVEGRFPIRPGMPVVKLYRSKRRDHYDTGGVLVDDGEAWWNLRSKAQQPLMKAKNINNYISDLGSIADEFIDRLLKIKFKNQRFYLKMPITIFLQDSTDPAAG